MIDVELRRCAQCTGRASINVRVGRNMVESLFLPLL